MLSRAEIEAILAQGTHMRRSATQEEAARVFQQIEQLPSNPTLANMLQKRQYVQIYVDQIDSTCYSLIYEEEVDSYTLRDAYFLRVR